MLTTRTKRILGVDLGNFRTKTANFNLPSGYKEIPGGDYAREIGIRDIMEFGGRCYVADSDSLTVLSDKSGPEFVPLTLLAMAKELEAQKVQRADGLVLSLGLPPRNIQDPALRAGLVKVYRRDFDFKYNDFGYHVKISDVKISPQAYSALSALTETQKLKTLRPIDGLGGEPLVLAVDLGGRTMDIVGLKNGKPDKSRHVI
jgi:hypothetical protein